VPDVSFSDLSVIERNRHHRSARLNGSARDGRPTLVYARLAKRVPFPVKNGRSALRSGRHFLALARSAVFLAKTSGMAGMYGIRCGSFADGIGRHFLPPIRPARDSRSNGGIPLVLFRPTLDLRHLAVSTETLRDENPGHPLTVFQLARYEWRRRNNLESFG
jgi:hypothetical protein